MQTRFMSHCTLPFLVMFLLSVPHLAYSDTKKNRGSKPTPLLLQITKMDGAGGKNMVEVASTSPSFTTLTTAVKAADLVDTLSGPGPYTLFAPTNAAFDKLPKGTVETLLKPENKQKLKDILGHHAAAPSYNPTILSHMSEIDMVDGPKIKIENKDGKLFADGVEINSAIQTTNGFVYIVDSVLLAK